VAVPPEHVFGWNQDRGAGVGSALDRGVAVFDIAMDRDRALAGCATKTHDVA
jgi:hypothetical protein